VVVRGDAQYIHMLRASIVHILIASDGFRAPTTALSTIISGDYKLVQIGLKHQSSP
jgi:hypothetical protein